jgi:hypothetical protein
MKARRLTLSLAVLASTSSEANTVQIYAGLGLPLVNADLNRETREKLGAKWALDAGMMLHMNDWPLSMGVFYEAFVSSPFGPLPNSTAGLQISYYPFARPLASQNLDNRVSITTSGLTIYGTAGTGLTFFNYANESKDAVFGASAYHFRLSATADYPVSENFLLGFTSTYCTTFGGQQISEGRSNPQPAGLTGFIFSIRSSYLVF